MIRGYISRNGKEGEVGGKLDQIVRISYSGKMKRVQKWRAVLTPSWLCSR